MIPALCLDEMEMELWTRKDKEMSSPRSYKKLSHFQHNVFNAHIQF